MAGTLASVEKAALAAKSAGLYTGSGKDVDGGKKKSSFGKKTAGVTIVFLLLVALVGVVIMTPVFLIGTLGYGLKRPFDETLAVVKDVAGYVVKNWLAEGKIPDGLAEELLAQGVEVGQVTVAGEFVRTNRYVAELNNSEIAATGAYYTNGANGELVVRFNDEIITPDNFIAKLDESPSFYAAYSDAVDISSRYYYSDEVNQVYREMGINRNAFATWESTGDAEADQKSFNEILAKNLDSGYDLNTAGKYKEWYWGCIEYDSEGNCETEGWVDFDWKTWDITSTGSSYDVASALTSTVAASSRLDSENGTTANQNAAEFLNSTVSQSEPYQAANVYVTIMSAIERAQVGDGGPVNELMNVLSTPAEITYVDINTGEKKTESKSILQNQNFTAVVGRGSFSQAEAQNFSRDRILYATGEVSGIAIRDNIVSSAGKKNEGLGFRMDNDYTVRTDENDPAIRPADASIVANDKSSDAVRIGMVEKNSAQFQTIVGANRAIEGMLFVDDELNRRVLSALTVDANAKSEYQQAVKVAMEREIKAERATKSPFDISSPNTFMGNLVRKYASVVLTKYNTGDNVLSNIIGVTSGLAQMGIKSVTGSAMADNEYDSITTLTGKCATPGVAAGVVGDPYCSNDTALVLKYKDYSDAQFKAELGADTFDAEGEINPTSGLGQQIQLWMGRKTTVGTRDASVCATKKAIDQQIASENASIFQKIADFLKKVVAAVRGADSLEAECGLNLSAGSDEENTEVNIEDQEALLRVYNGAEYASSAANENREKAELYAAYIMHDQISSWLEDKESKITAFRKKYTLDYMDTVSGDEIATTE
ncbi:hypothetical protein IKG68_02125 [Candidatus Saccharibacteria bacterium]|nr:hypothetical protein [Candidatus Saccharibacteria bacterium]